MQTRSKTTEIARTQQEQRRTAENRTRTSKHFKQVSLYIIFRLLFILKQVLRGNRKSIQNKYLENLWRSSWRSLMRRNHEEQGSLKNGLRVWVVYAKVAWGRQGRNIYNKTLFATLLPRVPVWSKRNFSVTHARNCSWWVLNFKTSPRTEQARQN